MIIIGEKINGTRKEIGAAIENRQSRLIERLAGEQIEAGADYLDLNAGTHPDREPADLAWLVSVVQKNFPKVRLSLDSANPKALLAGIEAAQCLPMLNSLSGEKDRLAGVLPLASKYKTELVVLALDDAGIPETPEKRFEIVKQLVDQATSAGLGEDMLYIDPLVTTIATDHRSGLTAFEAIRQIKAEYPRAHITCGLSNISFGQPARSLINQAFAALAIGAGMDSAIADPCDKGLRNSIYSAELVIGQDPDCLRYNSAFRDGRIGPMASSATTDEPMVADAFWELSEALTRAGIIDPGRKPAKPQANEVDPTKDSPGTKTESLAALLDALVEMKKSRVGELTHELLEAGTDPMEILNVSKEAMSEVGRLFETREYFIPELILAGLMLKDISQATQPYLKKQESDTLTRGRVIIGTVEGDIHDIGKNIVVTLLEANGYEVMDLGVDVPRSRFVEAAKEFKPQVIGLSGFLTLAYDPMRDTIAAIKAENIGEIKFIIGGGQIDDQVMQYAGADGWGLEAMDAVNFCDQWIA